MPCWTSVGHARCLDPQQAGLLLQKSQVSGRYNSMKTKATAAENNSLDLMKCYKSFDSCRLSSRHRILRERASASISYASSNRVLSGWPHRIPHLPQVPGEATEQGPVVPSAARQSCNGGLDNSQHADGQGATEGERSPGQLVLPKLAGRPSPAHTFRPATAAADFAAAAEANLAPSRSDFCPPRGFLPENARPRTCSGVPRGKVLNKTLLTLRSCRPTATPIHMGEPTEAWRCEVS